MSRKNKALALIIVLAVLSSVAGSCSTQMGGGSDTRIVKAADGGEEEVLDEDRDEFGRPDYSSPENTAGGFMIAVGYLAMIIGSAVLPLLFL